MKLTDIIRESKESIKSQKDMIAEMKTKRDADAVTLFKKIGKYKARLGKPGEHIVTTIDDEVETEKTVADGEVVVRGPKGEEYVLTPCKFEKKYVQDKELTDDFQEFESKGMIRALEYEGDTFKFIADWGEKMLCKEGDYLAYPVYSKDDTEIREVYRIEREVFKITYKKVEDDAELSDD